MTTRVRLIRETLSLIGKFTFEVWSPSRLVSRDVVYNGITVVGINDMFQQYLLTGTGLTFYIGLIDASGFVNVDEDDTMSSHAGWIEIEDYDEVTRPAWGPDNPTNKVIQNATKANYTMNAIKTAKGLFVTSGNTKGGTTGILWSTGTFTFTRTLQSGQVGKSDYQLTGQGGA